ncbi:hypothetical protein LCGC14_1258100, partial [marine sediment metagenome]
MRGNIVPLGPTAGGDHVRLVIQ